MRHDQPAADVDISRFPPSSGCCTGNSVMLYHANLSRPQAIDRQAGEICGACGRSALALLSRGKTLQTHVPLQSDRTTLDPPS